MISANESQPSTSALFLEVGSFTDSDTSTNAIDNNPRIIEEMLNKACFKHKIVVGRIIHTTYTKRTLY